MVRLYYFPRPYPDELIGSILLRACRHLGVSQKHLLKLMAAQHSQYYVPMAMSKHLITIAGAMELNAYDLLWQNTVFPYATAFMSVQETCRLADTLMEDSPRSNAALTQSGTQGKLGQRYCEECIQEDQHTFGEAYWHRQHNLPFAFYCLKHLTPLRTTYYDRAQLGLHRLPEYCSGPLLMPRLPRDLETSISVLSNELLARPLRRPPAEWLQIYRQKAENRGFPRQGCGLASRTIARAFEDFFGAGFLASMGLGYGAQERMWPPTMLREHQGTPYSTQKHVLLQVFLDSPHAITTNAEYRQPGRALQDFAALDEIYVKQLEKALALVRRGTNRVTISAVLQQLDIWHIFRHNRIRLPKTVALLSDFKKTTFSARQTGKRPRKRT